MRTLISILGRTPQILTETLFGLWKESLLPDRIIVLTTSEGKATAQGALLDAGGVIAQLASAWSLDGEGILSNISILALNTPSGDIETADDASAFLDLCMDTVRRESASTGQMLFSIAGGRKTMSAALTIAAQCFGRTGDVLFHVLVPPSLESSGFFYPKPGSPEADASIAIVRIPFFQLRDFLPREALERNMPAAVLPELMQESMHVNLSISRRMIAWKKQTATLPPVLLAVMLFFLSRRRCPVDAGLRCPDGCMQCAVSASDIEKEREAFALCYCLVAGSSPPRGGGGILSLSRGNFLAYRSRLASLLTERFGLSGHLLGVQRLGKRRQALYCIRLPEAATTFEGIDAAILRGLSSGKDADI